MALASSPLLMCAHPSYAAVPDPLQLLGNVQTPCCPYISRVKVFTGKPYGFVTSPEHMNSLLQRIVLTWPLASFLLSLLDRSFQRSSSSSGDPPLAVKNWQAQDLSSQGVHIL